MYKFCRLGGCLALLLVLVSGCTVIDAAKLLYGNRLVPHTWLQESHQSSIPFEVFNEHTIIATHVEGVGEVRMVLDTGAAATVFFETARTRPLLNRLDNKISVGGMGKGDATDAYFVHDTHMRFGDVEINGLTTLFIKAVDNPLFDSSEVTYVDGVIGYEVFSRFVTDINFTSRVVRLSEVLPADTERYKRVPLNIEGNLPYVEIGIVNKSKTTAIPALLDTGGIGSLRVAHQHQFAKGDVLYRGISSGLGGESSLSTYRVSAVTLGPFSMGDAIIGVADDEAVTTSIVGTGIINRFDVIIDYAAGELLLSPNETFLTRDVENTFGAVFLPHTQGAYIDSLRDSGEATQLGFLEGDVITRINAQAVDRENYDLFKLRLSEFKDIQSLCYWRQGTEQCEEFSR